MPTILEEVCLEGMEMTVASFIRSRPRASERFLISAASECLKKHLPMNEAEILGASRRIRYSSRAVV